MTRYLSKGLNYQRVFLLIIVLCISSVFFPIKVAFSDNVTITERSRLKDVWAGRGGASWVERHKLIVDRVKKGKVDLIFIGDSIMHNWETAGKKIWKNYYSGRNTVNMGFGGDRTEHVLWRLTHGEIDGISPKLAVVMIGTNNSGANSSEDIAAGIVKICEILRTKLPKTRILLLAIFPRGEDLDDYQRQVNKNASDIAASELVDDTMIFYLDIGDSFLDDKGMLSKNIMPDYLHPNSAGYKIWAQAMEPLLKKLMYKY